MSKGKRVRITNDSLNSYGTRVLTAGMNVEQYQRNKINFRHRFICMPKKEDAGVVVMSGYKAV